MKNCIISFGLDLSKVTKDKIKKDEKGRLWLYLQASISVEPDQYGNQAAVWENQSREEREKDKRNYLGNGKITFFDNGTTVGIAPNQPTENEPSNLDLPF